MSLYYRQYFGKKFANGFFVEGFIPFTTSTYRYIDNINLINNGTSSYYDYHTAEDKKTTIGLGIGLGGKWVTNRNIIFEFSAGVARRFGDLDAPVYRGVYYDDGYYQSDDSYTLHPRVTLKGMLGIGYRF